MSPLEGRLPGYVGHNVLACALRAPAALLVARHALEADPDRILFLMDRLRGHARSGSAVFPVPPLWREVLLQLTGREFDVVIKFWEENTARLSPAQVGALLYHELRHVVRDGGRYRLKRCHDLEDWEELIPYGDWERQGEALPDLFAPTVRPLAGGGTGRR